MERYTLDATTKHFTKFKKLLSNTVVIESCQRKRDITNWKFYKLLNVTFFAALLKVVPLGCKYALVPDPLMKNHCIKFSTSENTREPRNDEICLFRALALCLDERPEEETTNFFNLYWEKVDGTEPGNFRGICMKEIAKWRTRLRQLFSSEVLTF